MPIKCEAVIKNYCKDCTIGGVRFIADDTKHWAERCFWLVMVALCWYGSALLILASWATFVHKPISFGVETNYLSWNTDFPAVGICENENLEQVYSVSDSIWSLNHAVDLEEVLKELSYFRGIFFYTLQYCNKPNSDPLCPKRNFSFYANMVRSDCRRTVSDCYYNGKAFDCCEYFHELSTDIGRCYVLNSVQTVIKKGLPMMSNRSTQLGHLEMKVMVPARVYTLGEEDVPALTTLQSSTLMVVYGVKYKRHVTVRNIENDPGMVETTPEQRACRYSHENIDGIYSQYSYSACIVLCRKRAQIKFCGCNDHFMPGTTEEEHCNMTGLECLNKNYGELTALRPRWARRPGLVCDCLPSCTETEVTVIKDEKSLNRHRKASVEIILEHLPAERFKRNVVRSRLDLVVSVGGTMGLFVGASLLSFVELVFYFTLRLYGNAINNNKIRRRNSQRMARNAVRVNNTDN